MKNRFIKIFLVIVLLFSLCFISFKYVENIKADSGWDSDYDSGSSWDTGSDWGSSSWDDDWGSSSSSGGSSCTTEECRRENELILTLIAFFIIVIPLGLVIVANLNNTSRNKKRENQLKEMFASITQEKANSIISNFDIEKFNSKAYQIFYDIQMSWMDFDYNKLKDLVTDELYNSYVMQLDALKIKNHKNIMREFELIDCCLFDLKEENGKYIAKVGLSVSFYDYVENINTGIILRGTPSRKLNNTYVITFIKTKEENKNINICPRCAAPVEGNSTGICEYCKSKLVNETHDWVMSKKEKISQK